MTSRLLRVVLLLLVGFLAFRPAPAPIKSAAAMAAFCPGNALANGDFEQGKDAGWTSVPGVFTRHDLIGPFTANDGTFSAMLGGQEGDDDAIWQAVTLPNHARLTYAWWKHTFETTIFNDYMWVDLLDAQGTKVIAVVDGHGIRGVQETWQTASVDLSRFAGQNLRLRFSVYNDNYFFSTFFIDTACLFEAQNLYLPVVGRE